MEASNIFQENVPGSCGTASRKEAGPAVSTSGALTASETIGVREMQAMRVHRVN